MFQVSILCLLFSMCIAVTYGTPIDSTKETAAFAPSEFKQMLKRSSSDEINAILTELATEEEMRRTMPSSDREKLQNYALLQYLLLHKPSLIQEKRLDKAQRYSDGSEKVTQKADPYDDSAFYVPRLGKKSYDLYTPRLGRSIGSGEFCLGHHITWQKIN